MKLPLQICHVAQRMLTLTGFMLFAGTGSLGFAQTEDESANSLDTVPAVPTVPVFEDGEAQIVDGFQNQKDWIRHDLWVVTEFDSDDDGAKDRMHVSVTRQRQTDMEGLKVPVVYVTSPYFSGTGSTQKPFMWDPEHELGETPPHHEHPPEIKHQSKRPSISGSHTRTWVPRGYAVVHSCSPGTGLSVAS